jgi:hypothetical protein
MLEEKNRGATQTEGRDGRGHVASRVGLELSVFDSDSSPCSFGVRL